MTYQAQHLSQFHDPSGKPWPPPGYAYAADDCWATVGAMAADFATLGKWTPTPPQIRSLSGNDKRSGNVGDIATALRTKGITVNVPAGGRSWVAIQAKLATGRWGVCIATDYDVIPDAKSCQPNFDGLHMIWLPPVPEDAQGRDTADDPLCPITKVYPKDIIRQAARKCANEVGSQGLIVAFVKQAVPPKPAPTDPKDAQIAALTQQVADLTDANDDLQARIDAATAALQGANGNG